MKILILAGGNGTRLWPVSRIESPKQFQKLIDNKSFFEIAVERLLKRYLLDDIYILIPQIYFNTVKSLYPHIKDDHIIIEPYKWDNLACIGYASFVINKKFPDENIFLAWSDHIIKDEEKFLDIIAAGDEYSKRTGKIIRIGAKATYPEVNWGYIKFGDQIEEINKIKLYSYEGHFEKPDLEKAEEYVESYEYLWNMGYIICPSKKLLEEYKKNAPDAYKILENITSEKFIGDKVSEYKKVPKISIDYAILEKADRSDFIVIPADVGWNDVGDWSSLKKQLEKNVDENIIVGSKEDTYILDSKDILVYDNNLNKNICIIGLENIVIVDTKDTLLVCSRKKSRDVKKLLEMIKEKKPQLC